jgi:hypothetical protein
MIERAIIIARRKNKCGWLRQCGSSGLWLILMDNGDQGVRTGAAAIRMVDD